LDPASARPRAIALPSPLADPVTMATFSFKLNFSSIVFSAAPLV
jgi:hypothetical protein